MVPLLVFYGKSITARPPQVHQAALEIAQPMVAPGAEKPPHAFWQSARRSFFHEKTDSQQLADAPGGLEQFLHDGVLPVRDAGAGPGDADGKIGGRALRALHRHRDGDHALLEPLVVDGIAVAAHKAHVLFQLLPGGDGVRGALFKNGRVGIGGDLLVAQILGRQDAGGVARVHASELDVFHDGRHKSNVRRQRWRLLRIRWHG